MIRSRSMLPRLARLVLVLVLVLVAGLARADDAPGASVRLNQAARFAELVRKGDQARGAGKLSEAVSSYSAALQIRRDARVRGRLGLVALEAGATAEAVGFLLDAIMDGHDAPPAEQRRIHEAYLRARPLVCRLDITISHLGAEVRINGELEPGARTKNDFFVFVEPGTHEVRASLPGFKDAVRTIDAPKGGRESVPLELVPNPPPAPSSPSSPAAAPSPPPFPAPSMPSSAAAQSSPTSSAPSMPPSSPSSTPRRWTPAFGATMLYGALSPLPAFGLVASLEWPIREVISWRIDLRGALSPRGIEGAAIRGALVGAWPGLCGTVRGFSGCLLASAGALNRSMLSPAFSQWLPFVGFGAGGMAATSVGPVDLRVSLDAVVLVNSYSIKVGVARGERTLWDSHPLLAGLSVAAAVR